jgi:hypothetical protein
VTVRAELEGHELDLAALARDFPSGDTKIVVDDRTYLETTVLDDLFDDAGRLIDGRHLIQSVADLLARINGLSMLEDARYRPVRLRNRFVVEKGTADVSITGQSETQVREHTVVVVGTAEARLGGLVTTGGSGSPATSTPVGPRQLARAKANSDADDLFALIGNAGAMGWDTLWKALEIVRAAVGGKAALTATGWVTADDLDVFGYSANHPDASGVDARHARRRQTTASGRVMSIDEGQQFIRDLSCQWLSSLS